MRPTVLIAFGANKTGPWGTPAQTIERAIYEMNEMGVTTLARSKLYTTSPLGTGFQDQYVNGAIAVKTFLPPLALLRVLKRLERKSGRRGGRPWGPRTLDLDVIEYKGLVLNWDRVSKRAKPCRPGGLVLPHAQIQERPFVLVPLMDIAPTWRHPVFHKTARQLMQIAGNAGQGRILTDLNEIPTAKS